MTHPFYTIGHSTRALADFVSLLQAEQIEFLVDIRTVPRSRRNPQYNRESLPQSLQEYRIGYEHMAELGGLRGKGSGATPSPNAFWTNDSFRNYADYAQTAPFRAALIRLRALGAERRCTIMCAEALWWRCHRRIVADYLLAEGEAVFHILGPGHVEPAHLSPVARRQPDGSLVYPAEGPVQGRLELEA